MFYWTHVWIQESPPAWTQEAYRLPCSSEYSFCCPILADPPPPPRLDLTPPVGWTWPTPPPAGWTWLPPCRLDLTPPQLDLTPPSQLDLTSPLPAGPDPPPSAGPHPPPSHPHCLDLTPPGWTDTPPPPWTKWNYYLRTTYAGGNNLWIIHHRDINFDLNSGFLF